MAVLSLGVAQTLSNLSPLENALSTRSTLSFLRRFSGVTATSSEFPDFSKLLHPHGCDFPQKLFTYFMGDTMLLEEYNRTEE
mmetsp:Transcript_46924/g.69442  ORF Transcript_46924/g.69442 Transcript_46924/m.69442 type:complete len:82 (+) Transcript_46924:576-821(+)